MLYMPENCLMSTGAYLQISAGEWLGLKYGKLLSGTHLLKNTLQTSSYPLGIYTKPLDRVSSLDILKSVCFWALAAVLMCAKPSSAWKKLLMRAISADATEFTRDTHRGIPVSC